MVTVLIYKDTFPHRDSVSLGQPSLKLLNKMNLSPNCKYIQTIVLLLIKEGLKSYKTAANSDKLSSVEVEKHSDKTK